MRDPEQVEPVVELPEDALAIQATSWRELQVLALRFTEDLQAGEPSFVKIDCATTNTELARTTS